MSAAKNFPGRSAPKLVRATPFNRLVINEWSLHSIVSLNGVFLSLSIMSAFEYEVALNFQRLT
jgi:hypothetical protein